MERIVTAPEKQHSGPPPGPPTGSVNGRAWGRALDAIAVAVAVATLAVLLLVYVRSHSVGDVEHRVEEVPVVLGGGAITWFPVTLETKPHGTASVDVRIDVPTGVQIDASAGVEGAGETSCGPERCVHVFERDSAAAKGAAPFRIGFSAPGRYRVFVEHASAAQRVREVFLVTAR